LAVSGEASTSGLLALVQGSTAETNYLVWSQILRSLNTVKSVFSDDVKIADGLKIFTLKLTSSAVQKIGWNFAPDENYLISQLRALLILTAGINGHNESVLSNCALMFSYTD
jgi:hypothetical protein